MLQRDADDVPNDEKLNKPSFHMVVETSQAAYGGKIHSASSIVGPIIAVMVVIGAAFGYMSYKRRSSPGINWPNLPLGFNIGKLGGSGNKYVLFH